MEVALLEEKYNNLEKRLSKVEQHEEKRDEIINQNSTNLSNIIIKFENITKNLETVTSSLREAIERSDKRRKERDKNIENRFNSLEKSVLNLSTKLETDKELIEKKVDERTIEKDSKFIQDMISKVVWLILSGMLGYFVSMFFK